MRVASWNVNGLRARLEFARRWLAARAPDVVGIQELKLTDDQFPHAELAAAGYRAVSLGQKAWNGVAILVREGLAAEVTQRGLPGQEELGARLLAARVTGPGGPLDFTTVYVPNGKHVGHADFPRKLAFLDALAEHVAPGGHARAGAGIVCGDFNVAPTALDSWDEEALRGQIFHTDEERARFARLLDAGFVDLFRRAHPDAREFSWWDYRGGAFHRRHGLRIDFLLATPAAAERAREVSIDREWRKKQDELTASDHAPVLAELA
jgi:exodeoxyribonuclease-3